MSKCGGVGMPLLAVTGVRFPRLGTRDRPDQCSIGSLLDEKHPLTVPNDYLTTQISSPFLPFKPAVATFYNTILEDSQH